MLEMGCAVSESDAVRIYIRSLRANQNVSQEAVADAMGMALRTYKAWELGETKDIKVPLVVRAIKFLGGAFDHLGQLDGASEADAERIALEWIKSTSGQNTHPKDQEVIVRFFKRQPPCTACGETMWRIGSTVVAPVLNPISQKPSIFGPFRVSLQIVCGVCSHIISFDTGEIPAASSEDESSSEPESEQ